MWSHVEGLQLLGSGCWMCAMWQASSPWIWPSNVHHMAGLQLSDLVLRCAPRGMPPMLRYGHQMCAMWQSCNPLIWPWDVHHVEGQQCLDMTVGRPPHGKPHPSYMVMGCATHGRPATLRSGPQMFSTWHASNPQI
jgi:hypothetical protein